jgi:hypothetical protein
MIRRSSFPRFLLVFCKKGLNLNSNRTSWTSVAAFHNMMLLSDLPDVLLISLLSSWLTIVEAAHLDSAICNHADRTDFINVAYKSNTLLSYSDKICCWGDCCDAMNKWILQRGAVAYGFHGTAVFANSHEERRAYLTSHGANILFLDWSFARKDEAQSHLQSVIDIVELCPNLRKFWGANFVAEPLLLRMAKRCPLLEQWHDDGMYVTPAGQLELCSSLRCLRKVILQNEQTSEEALGRWCATIHT